MSFVVNSEYLDNPPCTLENTSMSPGLCATCVHMRELTSDRGSIFYRCALSDSDPRFPRYPRLPVLLCDGYQPPALTDPNT